MAAGSCFTAVATSCPVAVHRTVRFGAVGEGLYRFSRSAILGAVGDHSPRTREETIFTGGTFILDTVVMVINY